MIVVNLELLFGLSVHAVLGVRGIDPGFCFVINLLCRWVWVIYFSLWSIVLWAGESDCVQLLHWVWYYVVSRTKQLKLEAACDHFAYPVRSSLFFLPNNDSIRRWLLFTWESPYWIHSMASANEIDTRCSRWKCTSSAEWRILQLCAHRKVHFLAQVLDPDVQNRGVTVWGLLSPNSFQGNGCSKR